MVALAVAIALRNAVTTACKYRTWTVAHATSVQFSNTLIDIVTNAIHVCVCGTISAAFTERIQRVAFAIAIAGGNVFTAALIDCSKAIADSALVQSTHAVISFVTDAIGIGILHAITSTLIQGIELVAIAVAIASGDAVASTHTALIQHVARTVALPLRNALASAYATLIQRKA